MSEASKKKPTKTVSSAIATGCMSGGVEAIAVWPMENIKTQLQLQRRTGAGQKPPFTGSPYLLVHVLLTSYPQYSHRLGIWLLTRSSVSFLLLAYLSLIIRYHQWAHIYSQKHWISFLVQWSWSHLVLFDPKGFEIFSFHPSFIQPLIKNSTPERKGRHSLWW